MADQAVMSEVTMKTVAEVTRIMIHTMTEMQTQNQKVNGDPI